MHTDHTSIDLYKQNIPSRVVLRDRRNLRGTANGKLVVEPAVDDVASERPLAIE